MATKGKLLGSSLIVMGTTIGGGVLALPVTTGFMGFFPSVVLFVLCWFAMLLSAFCFLDTNLTFKEPVNLITMTKVLLGPTSKIVCFVIYLLLLYSLAAAYIAGSVTPFASLLDEVFHWGAPRWASSLCLPLIFCGFIYLGTKSVDRVNRILMLGLFISFGLLIVFIPQALESSRLLHMDLKPFGIAVPLVITSFGYHIVIPSLVSYLGHDRKSLKKAIVMGSVLPLVLYIVWQAMIMGAVPIQGPASLADSWLQGQSVTEPLGQIIHKPVVVLIGRFAVFFAIVTSFLGVTMSLSDFITDGFKIRRTNKGRLLSMVIAIIPPFLFSTISQRGFIIALEFAGAFVAILLIYFPARLALELPHKLGYKSGIKRAVAIGLMAFAALVVVIDILVEVGLFQPFVDVYLHH